MRRAKSFFYVAAGVFLLAAAYQLGATRAVADWDGFASGAIVGTSGPQGSSVYDRAGVAWQVTRTGGWRRWDELQPLWDLSLPVPVEDVKFLNGDLLITTNDDAWVLHMEPGFDRWEYLGPYPGGPVPVKRQSFGKTKAAHR